MKTTRDAFPMLALLLFASVAFSQGRATELPGEGRIVFLRSGVGESGNPHDRYQPDPVPPIGAEMESAARMIAMDANSAPDTMVANRNKYEVGKKSPATAGLLAVLFPVAGHLYAGNPGRGLLFATGEGCFALLALAAGVERTTTMETGYYPVTIFDWRSYTYESTSYRINSLFWVGLAGWLGLRIWEVIDAVGQADAYNANLYNSIYHTLSDMNLSLRISAGYANRFNVGLQIGI